MADVSTTFRLVGHAETMRAFQQVAQGTQQIDEATKRATETTRQQGQALMGTRQSVSALSSAVANASSLTRTFGLEQTVVGRALEGMTTALYASTAALQSLRAGLLAARVAGIALIGTVGVLAVALLGLAAATERLSKWLDQHMGGLRQLSAGYRAWGRVVEEQAKKAVTGLLEVRAAQETQMALLPQLTHAQREHAASFADIATGAVKAKAGIEALEAQWAREAAAAKRAAEAASQHAAALRKLAEAALAARFALETEAILQFVLFERGEAEKTAEFRKQKFLEEAEAHARALDLELDAIVQFNLWQRGEWEKAAEARKRIFEEVAADQARLAQETAELIGLANQQAIQAIDEAEAQALAAGQELLNQQKTLFEQLKQQAESFAENFISTISSALVDVLSGVKEFGQGMTDLFQALKRMILQTIIEEALRPLQTALSNFFRGLFGQSQGLLGTLLGVLPFLLLQRGGEFIATRPTPLMVGETGAEHVSVRPLAAGAGGMGQITLNFYGATIFDEMSLQQFVRRQLVPVISRELSRVVG